MQVTKDVQEDIPDIVVNNNIHEDTKEDNKIDQFGNGNHDEQSEGDWVTTEVLEIINLYFQNKIKTMIDKKLSVIL